MRLITRLYVELLIIITRLYMELYEINYEILHRAV